MTIVRRVGLVLGALVLAACGGGSDTGGGDGSASDLAATFDTVRVRVFDEDGIECALCMWQADTATERSQGLMEVEDLGGASGMVFVYDTPSESSFWMKDTVIPLSIAYYDADGAYVGSQDMEPCADGDDCATHPAPGTFTYAIEVPQGMLDDGRLVPGSTIEIGAPCTPTL